MLAHNVGVDKGAELLHTQHPLGASQGESDRFPNYALAAPVAHKRVDLFCRVPHFTALHFAHCTRLPLLLR